MARGRKGYKMSDEHKAALIASRSSANKTSIPISKKLRLYAVDERNWAVQKDSGKNEEGETIWLSQFFYSTLREALQGLAQKLVNKELKVGANIDLESLADHIEEAEKRVFDSLSDKIPEDVKVA